MNKEEIEENKIGKYEATMPEIMEAYQKSIEDSEAFVASKGLSRRKRPITETGDFFDGHLPLNISKASIKEIDEVLVLMTAFADYCQQLAEDCKKEKDAALEILNGIKSKIRKTKTGPKVAQDDATITDIRYVDANAAYLTKMHSHAAIVAREEAARRDIKTLSRLITTAEINNTPIKSQASHTRMHNNSRSAKKWR